MNNSKTKKPIGGFNSRIVTGGISELKDRLEETEGNTKTQKFGKMGGDRLKE